MKSAESLASAADATTSFIICDIVRTGVSRRRMGSSSVRKMLAPVCLHDLDLLRKLVLGCSIGGVGQWWCVC